MALKIRKAQQLLKKLKPTRSHRTTNNKEKPKPKSAPDEPFVNDMVTPRKSQVTKETFPALGTPVALPLKQTVWKSLRIVDVPKIKFD
jgi:hypothetical protein